MRISDEEKQAVRKDMLTDLGLLDAEEVTTEESFEAMAAARKKDAEYYRKQTAIDLGEKAAALLAVRELEGKVTSLKADLESMKEEKCKWQREANNLKLKLESAKKSAEENAEVAKYFRNHLDESEPGDGNEWEEKARQIIWNEEDAKAARQEGDE